MSIALSEHHGFTHAKQVVAFAGLAPALRQSGQWSGSTHIAKNGDALLRKALYMPALCALRFNPLIRTFSERLKANGKNGKAVACAAMRKCVISPSVFLNQARLLTQITPLKYPLILFKQDGIYPDSRKILRAIDLGGLACCRHQQVMDGAQADRCIEQIRQ